MLIRVQTLEEIRSGSVTVQYRRWTRPRVKEGTVLRTAVGLVRITSLDTVDAASLTSDDAARAGHTSIDQLVGSICHDRIRAIPLFYSLFPGPVQHAQGSKELRSRKRCSW